jgi:hypothetical protein
LATVSLAVLGWAGLSAATAAQDTNIWKAAASGNIDAIKQHLEAGTDVDTKEQPGGGTPLLVTAVFGRGEAAKLLIEKGANVNAKSNDGATALHAAAFFCHTEIVKLLLDKGADARAKNIRGETALDAVEGEWSQELEGIYKSLGKLWNLNLDIEAIKVTRPQIAALLRKSEGKAKDRPVEESPQVRSTGYRGSYFVNGEIHVNTYGEPEGKPLTRGHQDFKPSWSKTGDMLVFFRRLKNDPVVTNWKTAIHVINVDGTGLHPLSDGTHTDFNQTWTRDGTNTPIWNRKHPDKVSFYVMASKVGNKPGQEIALTD